MVNPLKTTFQDEDQFALDYQACESVRDVQFRINRRRNMPVVKAYTEIGYYLFPSENSYDQFKVKGGDLKRLDAGDMGVPLLQILPRSPSIGSISGSLPMMEIFKFVLFDARDPPPALEHDVVAQNAEFVLYKVPFCEIHRYGITKDTNFDLIFPFESQMTQSCTMTRPLGSRDLQLSVGTTNLRWCVPASHLITKDHYTLQIVDSGVSDDAALEKKPSEKPQNIVIAHYTRTYRDVLPHRSSKRANLYVGERADQITYGIEGVPTITQVLACQGLIIHVLEHLRRDDTSRRTTSNLPAYNSAQIAIATALGVAFF